ncbi:bifunctional anthranilate synthase component II/anthranilate phosphoribosyltransferase [Zavarzinia compransoris]|uniref:bifunctional anthranilate synthase component II/anthranilate phosphoribosyltransferase n=1 Tax=Zavarzinia marina TaxID=2911065 RepID=UPI001F38AB37|nr:bifunctional anthranilate synthase component II/anthranilate phosphoribosyltransferase [Zavarzinia marina]MCF4164618.1 bifunctional anthranilate synthase component II/anthranilate phosphoribosyltransferase [Zavarzinia marina]
MIALIDNYDSFTYNLYHFLGELGAKVQVWRNDAITVEELENEKPRAIVLSPGPCDPDRAGICLETVRRLGHKIPILGVCLGHQAIGQAYGGTVVRAPLALHGKVSPVHHRNKSVFQGLPTPFKATRYHSLIVARENMPEELDVTAETEDGIAMGVAHRTHPVHGVQFHPESIASEHGKVLLENFLVLAGALPGNQRKMRAPTTTAFKTILADVATGKPLGRQKARDAFELMMSGDASHAQIGAFLMALRIRGETVDELAAGVETMRAKMLRVEAPAGAIDVCGTGGDGAGTWNISSAASFVLAGLGVPVAKHGNRALSSRSGSAEVLAGLGVKLDLDPAAISRCISKAGIGFMFAPNHHSAMRFVGPVRTELGTRTLFNLLGPLSNPAGVKRQLLGVFGPTWVKPLAEVLKAVGTEKAWVVHGADGLDEVTTTGPTFVAELATDGTIREFQITPEEAGLPRVDPSELKGGDPQANTFAMRALFDGVKNAYRDIVCLNVAAGLMVADKVTSLSDGVKAAQACIDDGRARKAVETLVKVSSKS